jgi:hypothetical protein
VAPQRKAKEAPKKEYLHVLMAVHPLHGKAIPVATYDNEEAAWKAAAARNKTASHLAHHVKKVEK